MLTERLQIRRFRVDDLDALALLLSDNMVMKYLEKPYTRQEAAAFLYRYGITDAPQIYAVESRSTGIFVGYVIYHPYDNISYEIGWVLCKSQWGLGYASELTRCLIEDAKAKTDTLIMECVPQQIATKKIARKYQFSFVKNEDGLEVYALSLKVSDSPIS